MFLQCFVDEIFQFEFFVLHTNYVTLCIMSCWTGLRSVLYRKSKVTDACNTVILLISILERCWLPFGSYDRSCWNWYLLYSWSTMGGGCHCTVPSACSEFVCRVNMYSTWGKTKVFGCKVGNLHFTHQTQSHEFVCWVERWYAMI